MSATFHPTLIEMPVGAVLDLADFHRVMREACAIAGGQKAWAERHGISQQYVSDVLNSRRKPGLMILQALGLQLATRYVKTRIVNG